MERSAAPDGRQADDLLAYGVVLAVAAVLLVDLRFLEEWSGGTQLAIAAVAFVIVAAIAGAGARPVRPEAHRTAMLVGALALLALALAHLGEVLVDDAWGGPLVWMSAVFAGFAGFAGIRYRSAPCTLAAAGAVALGVASAVDELAAPVDEITYRWVATGLFAAFFSAALALRLRGERLHSTQLVNAAGIVLIALSFGLQFFAFDYEGEGAAYGIGRGWEMVIVIGSLLVGAFALFFRERGPGYVGTVSFLLAGYLVAGAEDETPTFVGWPVFLLGAAVLLVLASLRIRGSRD